MNLQLSTQTRAEGEKWIAVTSPPFFKLPTYSNHTPMLSRWHEHGFRMVHRKESQDIDRRLTDLEDTVSDNVTFL